MSDEATKTETVVEWFRRRQEEERERADSRPRPEVKGGRLIACPPGKRLRNVAKLKQNPARRHEYIATANHPRVGAEVRALRAFHFSLFVADRLDAQLEAKRRRQWADIGPGISAFAAFFGARTTEAAA